MKKCAVILSTFVGGAAVGAAAALLLAPKSGVDLQKDAKTMLSDHLDFVKEHIKRCKCMMMGMCDAPGEMATTEKSNPTQE